MDKVLTHFVQKVRWKRKILTGTVTRVTRTHKHITLSLKTREENLDLRRH